MRITARKGITHTITLLFRQMLRSFNTFVRCYARV